MRHPLQSEIMEHGDRHWLAIDNRWGFNWDSYCDICPLPSDESIKNVLSPWADYPYTQTLTVGRMAKISFLFPTMAVRRTIKSNCSLPHCYTNNTNTHSSSESLTQQERKQTLPMFLLFCVGNYPVLAKPEFHCCIASIIRSIWVHVFKESSVLLFDKICSTTDWNWTH